MCEGIRNTIKQLVIKAITNQLEWRAPAFISLKMEELEIPLNTGYMSHQIDVTSGQQDDGRLCEVMKHILRLSLNHADLELCLPESEACLLCMDESSRFIASLLFCTC